jgi:tetratricopeptide (TPR) repeat protein
LATRLPSPFVLTFVAVLAAAHPCAADDAFALARAGTAAIETRRFGDALEAFSRAAGLRPADASLCFGAGVAAFMLGRDAEAQKRFECALARDPGFVPAARWLGDLHYRAGRLTDAIAVYEAAAERSPDSRELLPELDDWRKEHALQSRFHEVRTEHFTALFESPSDEPLARSVVDRLEAAYSRVGGVLGVYPPRRINVVLYTREQFAEITKLADWSVAAFDGRIRLPIAGASEPPDGDELDRRLSHEFVHAVVAMLGGRAVPAWLNEGLATVLEPAGSADVETAFARTTARPALVTLHKGFVALPGRDEAEIAYAAAARAVRRLMEQRGATALVALLQDLSRGETFAAAFRDRTSMRYEDFAARVVRD